MRYGKMDINYPRLFSPWDEGETQRVVVTGFTGEKGADKVIPKVQKHFPKEQFEAKCFFGLTESEEKDATGIMG